MFLSIQEALEEIVTMVNEGLGPIANGFKFTLTDAVDMGIQLAATILLFVVIRIFFWKPITKILEDRRAAIDKKLEEADEAKKSATEIEAQLKKEQEAAQEKIKEMLTKAEADANVKREEIINSAKDEARRRLDNLAVELEQERKGMEDQIRKEIVDIAFAAAEKIVAKEIDQDKYLDVVDGILKEASK